MTATRRSVLAGAAALAAGPAFAQPLSIQDGKSRLILLGTGGGPTPNRAAPAQVIMVGNAAYVIDCGNGVARQLVLAGVPLNALRAVFLTHHHSDHNADYGNLLLLAWSQQARAGRWARACMMRTTTAASGTVRAKTDTQSSERHAGTTPSVDVRPTVGLMPTQPQKCAGTRPAHGRRCVRAGGRRRLALHVGLHTGALLMANEAGARPGAALNSCGAVAGRSTPSSNSIA